jgi:predicted GIY-YIG superfamily endonuclease
METQDTCLYIHTRKNDGGIFYIGIGDSKRPYSKHSRNRFWRFVVNKHDYDVTILKTNMTWEEACDLEIKMISFYGRKDLGLGCLVNMTNGGDGSKGCIPNEETRKKLSKRSEGKNNARFGVVVSYETRKKMSKIHKGKTISDETRKKMSKSLKGRTCSEETKKKLKQNSTRSKKIICSITGKIYGCITDAAIELGLKRTTLNGYLSGNSPNKTSLRYV